MSSRFFVPRFCPDNDPDLTLLTEAEFFNLPVPGDPIGRNAPVLRYSAVEELSDFVKLGLPILVSEKVREEISKFGAMVEFVPADVDVQGSLIRHYIINVLQKCDCLDYGASGVEVEFGLIASFERLRLLDDRVDNVPLFLLPDNGQHVIFFRQDVVEVLQRSDCTGVTFIPPDECSMGM